MDNILLTDVETSGKDPDAAVLEIGAILYSVPHRAVLAQMSCLLPAESNPAEHINGLSVALLQEAPWNGVTNEMFMDLAKQADAVTAWNCDFDRGFIERHFKAFPSLPWFDAMDMPFPNHSDSRSLVSVALAHGIGVLSAHRALTDCDIMARLFTAMGDWLPGMIAHASRPKRLYKALVSKEDRQLAKDVKFDWHEEARRWEKRYFVDDIGELPFAVEEVEPFVPDTRPQALFQSMARPFDDNDLVKSHGFKWTGDKVTGWRRTMAIADAALLPFPVREVK